MKTTEYSRSRPLIILLACFLLCVGMGRIFSLVLHNPVLGYANNYDMIRLQACHQIWPSDRIVNITTGTPAAPLRRYTLEKHVDTPCFPSSELLFTSTGIEIGKLKNLLTGESLISIKTVGLVKAIFLVLTALFASIYFYRQRMYQALLANGLVFGLVLSDPGVSLYMNTFYTEFSAIYFLYLALIGVVVLHNEQWRPTYSMPLLIGLLGFGFSKPQYIPLVLCLGVASAVYSVVQQQWKNVPALLICALMPLVLQASGVFETRNDSMIRVNKINLAGSMLGFSNQPEQLLSDLGLPETCKVLTGKNGYDETVQKNTVCPELNNTSHWTFISAMVKNPFLLKQFAKNTAQQTKNWVFDLYGQVEHARFDTVSRHRYTINDAIRTLPDTIVSLLALFALLLPVLVCVKQRIIGGTVSGSGHYLLLLAFLQIAVVISAVMESGLSGLGKNMHLYVPLALATIVLVAVPVTGKPATEHP